MELPLNRPKGFVLWKFSGSCCSRPRVYKLALQQCVYMENHTFFFFYSTNVGYDWQIQLVMSPQIVLGLLTNVLQATADEHIFIGAC